MKSMLRIVSPLFLILVAPALGACASHANNARASIDWAILHEPEVCRDSGALELRALPRGSVVRVEPLYTMMHNGKLGTEHRLLGASLFVRATPGMTSELLDAALECHAARHAAAGAPVPPNDPFVADGRPLEVSVTSSGAGFKIDIAARDVADARGVLARAVAFARSSGG